MVTAGDNSAGLSLCLAASRDKGASDSSCHLLPKSFNERKTKAYFGLPASPTMEAISRSDN